MATTITKSIGSGGGRDYSTITAWIAAIPANLVTADEQWIGECYNDAEFSESTAHITGKTTDATRNIILRCAAGHSFYDHADRLTNPLRYDQTKGVALYSPADGIQVTGDYVTVEGLQINAVGRALRQVATGTAVLFRNCITQSSAPASGTGVIALYNGTAVNCLAVNTAGGTGCISMGGNATFRNVTAVQMGTASNFGFRGNYDSPLYMNCASFGFGTAFRTGFNASSNYNASHQASPPGANSVASLTFADVFENVASTGTMDFRVKAGSGLIGAGTRDATNTADLDIVKSARSTTAPTIGAWEFAAGGATAYTLTADAGSYSLTGQAATLTYTAAGAELTGEAGAFTVTGVAAGLRKGYKLVAEAGSFTLDGEDAVRDMVMSAGAGSFGLTGVDATLTYTPAAGSYTLSAETGVFTLTGQAAGLAVGHKLTGAAGSYSFTGVAGGLAAGRFLGAEAGSYTLAGQDADLATTGNTYTLLAEAGAFNLSGLGATLTGPRRSTSTGGYRYYADIGGKRVHGTLEELRRLVQQIAEQDAEETVEQAVPPKPSAVRIKAGRAVKRAMAKAAPEVAKQEVEQARESMQDAYQVAFRAAVSELAARRIEEDEEEAMLLLL